MIPVVMSSGTVKYWFASWKSQDCAVSEAVYSEKSRRLFVHVYSCLSNAGDTPFGYVDH